MKLLEFDARLQAITSIVALMPFEDEHTLWHPNHLWTVLTQLQDRILQLKLS